MKVSEYLGAHPRKVVTVIAQLLDWDGMLSRDQSRMLVLRQRPASTSDTLSAL